MAYFTKLDNGLWQDTKTGAIGRLKKGRGRGWYVDSEDQTPTTRREIQKELAEERIQKLYEKNVELYKKNGGFPTDTGNEIENKKIDKAHKEWLKNAEEANIMKQYYTDYSARGWEDDRYNNPKEYTGDLGKVAGKHVERINTDDLDMRGLSDKENTDYVLGKVAEEKKEQAIDRLDRRHAKELQKEYDRISLESKTRQERAREIDNFNNGINPMEEWSDTVGDGYSDAQRKAIETEYALNFGDSSQGYKDTKDVPFSEKAKAVRELDDNKEQEEAGKDDWLSEFGHREKLDNKISKFKKSNDIEDTERRLSNIAEDYFYNEAGIYNENIEKEADKWAKETATKMHSEQTISREKANEFVNAFKTALEEEQNGYTQTVDWDGGTYEYSKDRLERMEQSGIKPLEHSYTGGGWQGTKYDSKLTTKEIAKTVQNELKKDFPDVKISRKTDYNSIDINIMSSEKDLYTSSSDIDRMSDKQVSDTIRDSIGGYTRMDDWLEKNNRKSANGTFTANDERDYLKEELETYRNRQGYRVSGDEWYLSDYGKKVVGSLNKNLNSYNYDDSDGMVDYFDTNFYGGVQIGKWDKPYVVENKKIEAKVERYKKRKNK